MYLCGFRGLLFHNYNRYNKMKHMSGLINSPSFVCTLQVFNVCTMGYLADINSEIKFFV